MKDLYTNTNYLRIRYRKFRDKKIEKIDLLNKILSSDTLLIALLPVFGYSIVFIYQFGKYIAIPIPTFSYDFSLSAIFSFSLIFSLLAIITVSYLDTIFKPIINSNSIDSVYPYIFPSFFVYSFYLMSLLIFIGLPNFQYAIAGAMFIYSLRYIKPLFSRKKSTYQERLIEQENKKARKEDGIINRLISAIGLKFTRVLFIYIGIMILAISQGYASAIKNENFTVASTKPECIILPSIHENLECYFFDRENHIIKLEYMILIPETYPDLTFKVENLGRLTIQKLPKQVNPSSYTPVPTIISQPEIEKTVTYPPELKQ